MLKKRIIFTLLYDSGSFVLSRNFRLQRVGDLAWLQRNYDFAQVAFFIDELIVLDVTRGRRDPSAFCETLRDLTAGCFVPIAAGGGVRTLEQAWQLLRSGADKIVVNTPLFQQPALVRDLAREFGQQCVVGSVDFKRDNINGYHIVTECGTCIVNQFPAVALQWLDEQCVGELYVNSIDQDGTGQGYDLATLDQLPKGCEIPVILSGGVGNWSHLARGLDDPRVDAVATAHLFNFVGDGLRRARECLIQKGFRLALWPEVAEILKVTADASSKLVR